MSILDQPSNNESELDFHNRGFLSNPHGLIKSDHSHFNGMTPVDPTPVSFYSSHSQVLSNGHTSPELNVATVNGVQIPLDDKDEMQNGQLGPISGAPFNCPSPQTPGGKKSFVEGQGNSAPAVYPWMKRIHVSHGKRNVFSLFSINHKKLKHCCPSYWDIEK